MKDWQPIETAPRDGGDILLYGTAECGPESRPPVGCERVHIAHWYANWHGWECRDLDAFIVEPTHWQPLPEPPE